MEINTLNVNTLSVKINDKTVLKLSEIELSILKDNIFTEKLEEDISSRIKWVMGKKVTDSIKGLKERWMSVLGKEGITDIPLDDYEFAKLIFKREDYKCRSERDTFLNGDEKIKL